MNRLFPSLTSEEFREGCKVALTRHQKKNPGTITVVRGDIVKVLAKIIRQRSATVCEAETETTMEDNHEQIGENGVKNHTMGCEKCGKRFVKIKNLMNHMEKGHLQDNLHMCTVCPKKFMNSKTLGHHMKKKHETEAFLCNECGEEFSLVSKLKVHQKNAHTTVICNREDCDFQGTPIEVRKHAHSRHRTGKSALEVKCAKCEKVFKSRQGFLYHKKKHEEFEDKGKTKTEEIPAPEHPGAANNLPGGTTEHPEYAPQPPVAALRTKEKKSKKKKEIPTLPAPTCEYEQIRANNVAEKDRLLKSLKEAENIQPLSSKPLSSQPLSSQPLSSQPLSSLPLSSKPPSFQPPASEHPSFQPPTSLSPSFQPGPVYRIQLTGLGLAAHKL